MSNRDSSADLPNKNQKDQSAAMTIVASAKQELVIEQGSVTVLIAAIAATLLFLSAVVIGVVALYGVQVKVQAVADLAALSGASQVPSALLTEDSGEAAISCGIAKQVAERNLVQLDGCWGDDGDIRLIVAKQVQWMGIGGTISGRARAGPT